MKIIAYPKSLKDVPPWRRRQIAQDILWFSRYSPTERLEYVDREWADIQNFIKEYGFRNMEPEKEISLLDVIRLFNRYDIRHLIIGRRAVILYGGPVLTGDNDIWIHRADREKALSLLKKLDFELSHPVDTKRPIVTAFSGMKKYDLFFHRSAKNLDDEAIDFDECYRNSTLIEDPAKGLSFRVPSIDDLIRLKKIRKPNVRDEQDIEYLLKAKQLRKP